VAQLSAANLHDSQQLIPLVAALPTVAKKRGRPKWKPGKLHADKAYDSQALRAWLCAQGILPRIARRGIESKERLGRHRWVIERTFSWLHRMRRLRIRYERRDDMHEAFLLLGCVLICWKALLK
jgi:transposase